MIWLLVALCLLLSFIFSGVEAGILSINRVRLAHHARQKDRAAMKLESILQSPDRPLITVLLITNLANILALFLVTTQFVDRVGPRAYLYTLAVYLPVYLVFLELFPKSIFRRFPYRALAALAGPLLWITKLLAPLHFIGSLLQRLLFRDGSMVGQRRFLGREDFKFFAAEGEKTGAFTKAESEMIHNVVEFRAVTALDVMTPLEKLRILHTEKPVAELLSLSKREPHDRWFVSDDDGRITGVISVFDILIEGRRDVNVGVYQRRMIATGPADSAYSVLRKLRAARSTVALVKGGDGQAIGLVSWDNLIRRLVATAEK